MGFTFTHRCTICSHVSARCPNNVKGLSFYRSVRHPVHVRLVIHLDSRQILTDGTTITSLKETFFPIHGKVTIRITNVPLYRRSRKLSVYLTTSSQIIETWKKRKTRDSTIKNNCRKSAMKIDLH